MTKEDAMSKRVQARRPGVTGYANVMRPSRWGNPYPVGTLTRAQAVAAYRAYAETRLAADPDWLEPLRGRDLGCTCPPDEPCHVDVLLELLEATP